MAINQDAERLVDLWRKQLEVHTHVIMAGGLKEEFLTFVRELQGKDLLGKKSRVNGEVGEYVIRFSSHGGPIFLTDGNELIFADGLFAVACAEIYAKKFGEGVCIQVLKIYANR